MDLKEKLKKPKKETSQPRARAEKENETQTQQKPSSASETHSRKAEEKLSGLVHSEPAVRKIVRKAAILADLITEEDLEADARVIRDATNAMLHVYDGVTKTLIEKPDHKTRLAATTLRRAYHEGKPVERQAIIVQKFESMDETRERIANSPELLKIIGNLQKAGVTVKAGGEIIEADALIQKTGGQNPGVASEET